MTIASALRQDARREQFAYAMLTLPSLALVTLAVVLPVGWLFWQSAFDDSGAWTAENYTRLFSNGLAAKAFVTTFELSAATLVFCVALGIPLSLALVSLSPRAANRLMIAVLLPLWTSLLVRTYAWLVILQRHGLVNEALSALGLTSAPLDLVNNFTGVLIGMVHVMLPLFILPTYAAMRDVDPNLMKAAASLGSGRLRAISTILLPLSMGGILSGALVVFVFSLGFYIIPAILGGGNVNPLSIRIERTLSIFQNWGSASALGVLLLLIVALFGLGLNLAQRLIVRSGKARSEYV